MGNLGVTIGIQVSSAAILNSRIYKMMPAGMIVLLGVLLIVVCRMQDIKLKQFTENQYF